MLTSRQIASFPTAETPGPDQTIELLDSGMDTYIVLSMLFANNAAASAEITVERLSSVDAVLSTWTMTIPAGNSPVCIDSMLVVGGGDKLAVTSDTELVSVDASMDQVA